jgi:RNA polymerase sigma-70 factor (ECF subfamily)
MISALLAAAATPDDIVGRPHRREEESLVRLRAGDERALEAIFRRLVLPLTRFARRVGVNEGDAEQIVTDVFYMLWEQRTDLPQPLSIDAYLFRAVRNRALNTIRDTMRELRRRERSVTLADDERVGADARMERADLAERIRAHIAALPEAQQTALFLRYTREMSIDEVSLSMGTSPGAVKMLLQRAVRALRQDARGLFEAL